MSTPPRAVVVPLDGSPASEQALVMGAAIARRAGAALHLVTVQPPPSTVPGRAAASPNGGSAKHALRAGLRSYLEEQAGSLRDPDQPIAVTCAVLDGWIAGALAAYSRAHYADLIVMTTHGWGGLKRLWLGSVADELVRRVSCPVLLMRPSRGLPTIGLHRVLVALGSADSAEAILEPALAIGDLVGGTRYTLLHVIEPQIPLVLMMGGVPVRAGDAWVRNLADTATGRLEHLVKGLRARKIVADARVLVGRGIGEQILNLARRDECDLIVAGTRRARGVDRLAFGSVADKVVRGATQMVLVVPVGVEAAAEARREAAALAESGQVR